MSAPDDLRERLEAEAARLDEYKMSDIADVLRAVLAHPEKLMGEPVAWRAHREGDTVQVPREPTQVMCQAGQEKAREWPKFPLRISAIYRAMLAAAPSAQKGEE